MEAPLSILMIVSDDHAAWALHENPLGVPTPNLDRLREEGTRFSNAFTPSPVCSPARACLITGKMPSEVGIHDWLDESDPAVAERNWLEGQPTLPQTLKKAGYQTYLSGKWHLGHPGRNPPGFDQAFVMSPKMRTHTGEDRYYLNEKPLTLSGNRSKLITDHAITFLEDADKEQPFFLNLGYFATHSPYVAEKHDPASLKAVDSTSFPEMPRTDPHPWGKGENGPSDHNSESERRSRWRGYASGVHEIDMEVGRIIQTLERQGRLENTLILYTSDHGCCLGHQGIWGKGNGTRPVTFTDSALKVPLLMKGPGIAAKTTEPEAWTHIQTHDFILKLAGLDNPNPVLPDNNNTVIAEYGDARMIRTPDWKYVVRYGHGPDSLFHLAEDPAETQDLADHPETQHIQARLLDQLEERFAAHTLPEHDGRRVLDLPKHNPYEPWRDGIRETRLQQPQRRL